MNPAPGTVTFNVVFMPGSVARLLPLALSLLQSPGARIRFVANGCPEDEGRLLDDVAAGDDRLSAHELPASHPVEHGRALNHLFEEFPEPLFAFMDSDIVATGDYVSALLPLGEGEAGVFTAPPVWATTAETVSPPSSSILSGRRRTLHDGTSVGNTYCAVYDRERLAPLWSAAPRGFAVHHSYMLPHAVRRQLAERGWHYRTFDTARLLNLQLIMAGFTLANRSVPELHHIGGFTARDFEGARGSVRSLRALLRSSSTGRWRRVADGVVTRAFARTQHDPTRAQRNERRRLVLSHLDDVMDALTADAALPAPVGTDSTEVDEHLAALVGALRDRYPPGLAVVRGAAVGTPGGAG